MIEAIEGRFKIRRSLVYSFSRNREGALGRSLVAYLGRRWAGYSLRVVADHFGRDPVVISVGVKRLEERLGADRGFSQRVEILEKNLIRNKKILKVN